MLSVFFCFSADLEPRVPLQATDWILPVFPPFSTLHNFLAFETDASVIYAATTTTCLSACKFPYVNRYTHTCCRMIFKWTWLTCGAAFLTVIFCSLCLECWSVTLVKIIIMINNGVDFTILVRCLWDYLMLLYQSCGCGCATNYNCIWTAKASVSALDLRVQIVKLRA